MLSLSSRQSFILNQVVDTFIGTGHPVSSKAVACASPSPISSATIRYEMGALEETGYLVQAHHSSGRIPTDRGYRHYLNYGIPPAHKGSREPFERLSAHFIARFKTVEEKRPFAEEFASVLSELSQQLGILVVPDSDSDQSDEESFQMTAKGLSYFLDKPECQDLSTLKPLVAVVEERETLKRWISEHASGTRPRVFVGAEHEFEELEDFAIVTACFDLGEAEPSGALAVIGLKRMAYAKVLPIVTEMTQLMESTFRAMRQSDNYS